ncbi:hypothetical protein BDW22DRAFT_902879 [Trametopsis cervina]|nr:hypothetical protein BDW22DRAFT_902879 [Trametopsis cervina]
MSVQAPTAPATTHCSFSRRSLLPPENARAQAHSTLRPRHCCTYSVTPCTLPRIRPSSTPGPPSHPHQPGARLPSARPCNASRLSTPETRCASSTASAHMQNETGTPAPISSADCTSLIGHLRRYLTVRASLLNAGAKHAARFRSLDSPVTTRCTACTGFPQPQPQVHRIMAPSMN